MLDGFSMGNDLSNLKKTFFGSDDGMLSYCCSINYVSSMSFFGWICNSIVMEVRNCLGGYLFIILLVFFFHYKLLPFEFYSSQGNLI